MVQPLPGKARLNPNLALPGKTRLLTWLCQVRVRGRVAQSYALGSWLCQAAQSYTSKNPLGFLERVRPKALLWV